MDIARSRAENQPDRCAYVFLKDRNRRASALTYAELDSRARILAGYLQGKTRPGDRVVLLYPHGSEYVIAFLACLYAGLTAVPLYPPRPNQKQFRAMEVLDNCEPVLALTTAAAHAAIDAFRRPGSTFARIPLEASDRLPARHAADWLPPALGKDDLAFLQYTSGSTGMPKGAMVSHGNLMANLAELAEAGGFSQREVGVSWLPLYHDMGLIGTVLLALYRGFLSVHMPPLSFIQDPLLWLEAISRFRGNLCGGPNFAFELVLRQLKGERIQNLDLRCWLRAFNGAEPVRAETLRRFSEALAPRGFCLASFYPCYGMAETTLMISGGREPGGEPMLHRGADGRRRVGCGQVRGDFEVRIVEPESRGALPEGEVGEIWVRGKSVALGYWNRAEENERIFAARIEPGGEGPFLRTGDLGFLARGELFVSGRLKDLIIIGGRNHYPQDLELTAEASHAALAGNGGAAFSINADGGEQLVLALEVERRQVRGLNSGEVVEAVRRAVAERHDVRVHGVVLLSPGRLPKTSSGKVRRNACRESFLRGDLKVLAQHVLPEARGGEVLALDRETLAATPPRARAALLERFLVQLAAAALRVDAAALDPSRSLAGLGLDSLAAANLEHRLETDLGLRIPIEELFQARDFSQLTTAVLARFETAVEPSPPGSAPRPFEGDTFPLSHNQRALWFLRELAPESSAYHLSQALRFHARAGRPITRDRVRRAGRSWLQRHPSLRTVYLQRDGRPCQRVLSHQELSFRVADRTGWDSARLRGEMSAAAREPFDLGRGPLLRLVWYEGQDQDPVLLITVHHIAVDYWSLLQLLDELGTLCSRGNDALQPVPDWGYAHFVAGRQALLDGPRGDASRNYWQWRLAGELPLLELPRDRPRPPRQSFNGASVPLVLEAGLHRELVDLSVANGVTLFTTLLTAFQCLLHRYGGQEDVLVGVPTAGRERPQFHQVVGYFVNPVVMRADFGDSPSFRDVLRHNQRHVPEACSRADLPFLQVVELLRPERDPSRSPLFQAMFVFQNPHRLAASAAWSAGLEDTRIRLGDLEVSSLALPHRTALFDISLFMTAFEAGGEKRLGGWLEYNSDLFEQDTAVRLVRVFENLLRHIAERPDEAVATLPLLSPAEREHQLAAWNQAPAELSSGQGLYACFARAAARWPDAVIIVDHITHLSFAALQGEAAAISGPLRANGVVLETLVGVCLQRGAAMVASLLAIHRAGGAYLPLDPNYPADHLARVLQQAPLVLCESSTRAALPAEGKILIQLDQKNRQPAPPPLPRTVASDNLSHVIYTSGSTGTPKCVAVRHGSVVALLDWASPLFGEVFDGVLAATSICFDLSVFELFGPLCLGGTILLAENALALPNLPARYRVRLINTVPSAAAELLRNGAIPASVRVINLAGEPLRRALVDQLHGLGFLREIFNLYGPSEDTTYTTACRLEPGATGPPSIGAPITASRVHVLDACLQPLPAGVAGELLIGGAGLVRGYFGRPDLTATALVPNPFALAGKSRGSRLYCSGDLGRYRADGTIDFLGRRDEQVKLRGFRIEPGEIEAVLHSNPRVANAAILAHGEQAARRLVAYIQPRRQGKADEDDLRAELREFLQQRLPAYMVPATWLMLEHPPLKPNGKLDRAALARMPPPAQAPATAYQAPRNPREAVLAEIWAEVLALERVGVHDSFFELGGHSLSATRAAARIGKAFSRRLPVRILFEAPTVAAMARRLAKNTDMTALANLSQPTPQPLPVEEGQRPVFPLSFAQQRLWFLARMGEDSAAYHMAAALRFDGELDVVALEGALHGVVKRHDVLRARFLSEGDQPVQIIDPPLFRPLALLDLSRPGEAPAVPVTGLTERHARLPFDLARGPMLHALLIRLSECEHRLLASMHHIVADGWSIDLFLRELAENYHALTRQHKPAPPALAIQYGDFASWQRRTLDGEGMAAAIQYWREQLRGPLPVPRFPMDGELARAGDHRGARLELALARPTLAALRALARRRGATLFMTLLAAFKILLGRLTGERDVIVGVPSAGRFHPDLEPLIGCFLNTLALRGDLSGEPSFEELLGRVRQTTLEAFSHEILPFEKLVELLQPNRSLSRHPLFDVMLNQVEPAGVGLSFPGLAWGLVEPDEPESKFFMTLYLEEHEHHLDLRLVYRTALFSAARMVLFLEQFQTLLEQISANPAAPIHEYSLITRDTRSWLPDPALAIETRSFPDLGQLFDQWVAKTPHHPAVSWSGRSWSYARLAETAAGIAAFLKRSHVPRGAVVAVSGARSLGLIAAILAVLRTGRVLLTLDTRLPPRRRALMLAEAGTRLLLITGTHAELGEETEAAVATAFIDPESGAPSAAATALATAETPPTPIHDRAVAYLFFTSGSSGVPKAVLGTHRGLSHFLVWQRKRFAVGPADRCSQLSGLSFDVVLRDMLLPLTSGATLCLPEDNDILRPAHLFDWLVQERISLIHAVPSLVRFWLEDPPVSATPDRPRLLFLAGEPLPGSLVCRWRERFGRKARIINLYGPTETTLAKCFYEVPDLPRPGIQPVGRPLPGVQVWTVDERGRSCGVGEPGEIVIRTPFRGLGYWQGRVSHRGFRVNRARREADDLIYHSGDLGRFLPDGTLEILGRLDRQLKIRGIRIEPAEIEARLRTHAALEDAAVIARPADEDDPRLVAFVQRAAATETAGPDLEGADLARFLRDFLPEVLIPTRFVFRGSLPLTANGKVDRQALAAMDLPELAPVAAGLAPRGETEIRVAAMWRDLLDLDTLGLDDNFFEVGGHSLLLARVQALILERFKQDVPMLDLFRFPTVRTLAARLSDHAAASSATAPPEPRLPDRAEARQRRRDSVRARKRNRRGFRETIGEHE